MLYYKLYHTVVIYGVFVARMSTIVCAVSGHAPEEPVFSPKTGRSDRIRTTDKTNKLIEIHNSTYIKQTTVKQQINNINKLNHNINTTNSNRRSAHTVAARRNTPGSQGEPHV